MALILGIHNGHHASTALVSDGLLVAAVEQERVTRLKADGSQGLSNRLPVRQCLECAGASLNDVDLIVSSFQAIGPGGVGLTQPLIHSDFKLFDPFDQRHFVISHHYAHALSAISTSGFRECATLICDLAGSTTRDGKDFAIPFADFVRSVTTLNSQANTFTECLSIYHIDEYKCELQYRDYCVPHSAPEVFIYSPASLYDNAARMIFGKENAHGELMALASMATNTAHATSLTVEQIVECFSSGIPQFKNDWQHCVRLFAEQLDYAPLAAVVQEAFQKAILAYARKAHTLTNSTRLTAAGGSFLNIVTNTAIESSGIFEHYFVPSAPHDAGIAIGCAYHGWRCIAEKRQLNVTTTTSKASDRIGSAYSDDQVIEALQSRSYLVACEEIVQPSTIASLLKNGQIIARFAGRAEFGPRALGGRSLLATPLKIESKDRLNRTKGRQPWRPVAPIVLCDQIAEFFVGPEDSPYMNMVHRIVDRHRGELLALWHPDGSARVQTLRRKDDEFLYETIHQFSLLTGYPMVVNTSFNGPNEPIVETPQQAIDFFAASDELDCLLLGERLIRRVAYPSWQKCSLASDVIVSVIRPGDTSIYILLRRGRSMEISKQTLLIIERMSDGEDIDPTTVDAETRLELCRLLFKHFLVPQ